MGLDMLEFSHCFGSWNLAWKGLWIQRKKLYGWYEMYEPPYDLHELTKIR